MGCKCQEIRNAIAKLPGGKLVVGMLPPLDPGKGEATGQPAPATGQPVGRSVTAVTTVTTRNRPDTTNLRIPRDPPEPAV